MVPHTPITFGIIKPFDVFQLSGIFSFSISHSYKLSGSSTRRSILVNLDTSKLVKLCMDPGAVFLSSASEAFQFCFSFVIQSGFLLPQLWCNFQRVLDLSGFPLDYVSIVIYCRWVEILTPP